MRYLFIRAMIEEHYDELTRTEKDIADFFLGSFPPTVSLAANRLSDYLHVSESTLTRFAQKCGFSGYREFSYQLKEQLAQIQGEVHPGLSDKALNVLADYEQILDANQELLVEAHIHWLTEQLEQAKRVYFYGKGFSGLVAQEYSIRFLRLGLVSEAVTNDDMLHWVDGVIDASCLVIGLSVSSETQSVLDSLRKASEKGARTCLITTQDKGIEYIDCTLRVATTRHLNYGNRISPQLPLSFALDIVFAYFMDHGSKEQKQESYERSLINGQPDKKKV
ncbi:MurR/RpiR family transcriptional regulator [Streptococcus danieliae]|nr:MurR/RpiR family transcriptional regulator [Streptococcus danieliae]